VKQDDVYANSRAKIFIIKMRACTIKYGLRLLLCALAVGAFFLFAHLHDLGDQYGVVDYFTFSVLHGKLRHPHQVPTPAPDTAGDKVIVMAKMEHEDTSWVADELPE
jgi:hypothetical protein